MTWAVQGLGEDNVNKQAGDGDSAALLGFGGCVSVLVQGRRASQLVFNMLRSLPSVKLSFLQ